MPSELDEALARHRQALLRQERAAASAMVRAYGESWQRLQEELHRLNGDIVAARAAGETVNLSWLTRQERLEALRRQVERELRQFAEYADGAVLAQQRAAVEVAQRNTGELLDMALGRGPVVIGYNRMPREAAEALVGFASDGSPLRTLMGGLGGGVGQGVIDALTTGLVTGLNPRETARLIRRAYGMGLTRALRISRTETLRAYREASRQSYLANSDIVKGWYWQAALSARTCVSCWAMHGSLHELNETLDSHPQCRCTMFPALKSWKELGYPNAEDSPTPRTGPELFAEQPAEVQRAVLGPAAYEAYRAGGVSLRDFVGVKEDARWGRMHYARSLQSVLGKEEADKYVKKALAVQKGIASKRIPQARQEAEQAIG